MLRTGRLRICYRRLLELGSSLLSFQTNSHASNQPRASRRYQERMAHCLTCDLFNHTRQTCGTAGKYYHDAHGEEKPYGCWCYLPIKAATACNCWAWERTGGEMGWPAELNDYR